MFALMIYGRTRTKKVASTLRPAPIRPRQQLQADALSRASPLAFRISSSCIFVNGREPTNTFAEFATDRLRACLPRADDCPARSSFSARNSGNTFVRCAQSLSRSVLILLPILAPDAPICKNGSLASLVFFRHAPNVCFRAIMRMRITRSEPLERTLEK